MAKEGAFVGVSDHDGWAVLITVAADTTVLDRRRIELVDANLPSLPHHREGQKLPIDKALALVDRVRASADRHAATHLDALASTVAARGWTVGWYNAKTVLDSAAAALSLGTLEQLFAPIRTSIGPPWGRDQKLAMAAAIASATTPA